MRPLLLISVALFAAPADDSVTLKTVKYDEWPHRRGLQGKIVVVDFWGEF